MKADMFDYVSVINFPAGYDVKQDEILHWHELWETLEDPAVVRVNTVGLIESGEVAMAVEYINKGRYGDIDLYLVVGIERLMGNLKRLYNYSALRDGIRKLIKTGSLNQYVEEPERDWYMAVVLGGRE